MKKLLTMRAALQDPAVLGSAFGKPAKRGWLRKEESDSWLGWRALLIAIVGEALNRQERRAFQSLTKRAQEPLQVAEEFIAVVGRRGGKSLAGAVLLTFLACLVDYSDVLNVGEKAVALLLAQNQKQATVVFNYCIGIIENSPMLQAMIVSKTADTIELVNNVTIEVRASSHRGVRGVTAIAIITDELAFWPSEGVDDAASVLNALRPALATTGGMLVALSSPYSKRGELWELYQRHYGADGDPAIVVAQGASRDLNPSLPERVVARALERDPVSAAAEYLAQFRDDRATGYIDRVTLDAAVDKGVTSRPPVGGHVAFIDAASGLGETKDGDRFAMAVGHIDDGVVLIDHCQEWLPPFNASSVTAEACGVIKNFGISEVVSDGYSAGFLRAELARHGVGHRISEMDKSRLYLASLPMLTSRKVRLLDLPTITDEWAALERRPSSSGHDKIDAKGHEDGANCCAGVIALLSASSPIAGWGVLEHMRRMAQAASTDRAPPTLAEEHGREAVMQIGTKRPSNFVRVTVPSDCHSTHIMTASGQTYMAEEAEADKRVVYMSVQDAIAAISSPLALTWFESNRELRVRLLGQDRPKQQSKGVKVDDLIAWHESQRPRSMWDRGGHAADALRAIGRWK